MCSVQRTVESSGRQVVRRGVAAHRYSADEEIQKEKAGANASLLMNHHFKSTLFDLEVNLRYDLTRACSTARTSGNSESGEIGRVRSRW